MENLLRTTEAWHVLVLMTLMRVEAIPWSLVHFVEVVERNQKHD